jgi:hypothetical protein
MAKHRDDDSMFHAGDEAVEPHGEVGHGPQPPKWWQGKDWPAGGVKSKQDLLPYLKDRLDELCSGDWSSEPVVREIAVELAQQAVRNAHAAFSRLGGKKPPRPSADQLKQTNGIESALEDLLNDISPGWGKGESVANQGTKDAGTQPGEPTGSVGVLLRVAHWDDLGIGIGDDGYWAFSPCPEFGAKVAISKAKKLPLKGQRWLDVLQWFARSEDGRTAKRSDLVVALGYLLGGKISKQSAEYDDGLHEQKKAAIEKLTNAMSDLGRKLRELIATEDKTKVFQVSPHKDNYIAAFTVRCLWHDDQGRLRFGQTF